MRACPGVRVQTSLRPENKQGLRQGPFPGQTEITVLPGNHPWPALLCSFSLGGKPFALASPYVLPRHPVCRSNFPQSSYSSGWAMTCGWGQMASRPGLLPSGMLGAFVQNLET